MAHARCYQVQIGHGGRHQQLKERLFPAQVARFAGAKLHQAGKAMFRRLAKPAIGRVRLTVLKGPGLLQQSLLGMQRYASSLARFALHTRRMQRTRSADRRVKLERIALFRLASTTCAAVRAGDISK